MPFWVGAGAVHDDNGHFGSAKRDTASGLAGIAANGDIIAPGGALELTRDGSNIIYIVERTSGEQLLKIIRYSANDCDVYFKTGGAFNQALRSNMIGAPSGLAGLDASSKFAGLLSSDTGEKQANKNAASGYPGLDASVLLALAQQRLNFKIVAFNRDMTIATGTQAVTGAGFTPRLVIFFASRTSSNSAEACIGIDDGTTSYCVADIHNVTANAWFRNTGNSIYLAESGSLTYTGVIQTMDADGFTVSWTRLGVKAGTAGIAALCIR